MILNKKVTFFLILGTMTVSSISFAKAPAKKSSKKTVEKILINNKNMATDPGLKIKLDSIRELSEDEVIFHNLKAPLEIENNVQLQRESQNPGFQIPSGVPGFEDGGVIDNPTSRIINKSVTNNNGLTVATGAGGNATPSTAGGILDGIIMVVDKLIAIGEKIIPTIEKGRPAVSSKAMSAISVLPRIDAKDPVVHDMGGWSIPVTKHYRIRYSNGYGSNIVEFVYSVTFQYGGTYGGKGKYLAGVRVAAQDIKVDWGYDLDATSQLIQISNVGTAENVVAGATLEISYTVKNVFRVLSTSESFFVTGEGKIYKLD